MPRQVKTDDYTYRGGESVVAERTGSKNVNRTKTPKAGAKFDLALEETRPKNATAVNSIAAQSSPLRFSARQKALNEKLAAISQKSPPEWKSDRSPKVSKSPSRRGSPSRSRSSSRSRRKPVDVAVKEEKKPKKASVAERKESPLTSRVVGKEAPGIKNLSNDKDTDDGSTVANNRHTTHEPPRSEHSKQPIDFIGYMDDHKLSSLARSDQVQYGGHRTKIQSDIHFGGPVGAMLLTLILPILVLALNLMCNQKTCSVGIFPDLSKITFFNFHGFTIYVGWILFQAIIYLIPIGKVEQGRPLLDGRRLSYRINGPLCYLISIGAVVFCLMEYDVASGVINNFIPMLTTSILITYLLAIVMAVKARYAPVYDYAPTECNNTVYTFFMGKELNPRFTNNFDVKMFLELRPGLIGWAALNLCFLYKDYQDNGSFHTSLAVSALLQLLYVSDALYFEESILSTMDIKNDGLGFMLIFGNLTFVPFVFTLQSRFLFMFRRKLLIHSWYTYAIILFLNMVGYFIFRASNLQKHAFRRNRYDPSVSTLETIKTGLPSEILVDGWWGKLRHPNYLGDILMAVAWCLPAGFSHFIPYTYAIYLTLLLIHRAHRDDLFCRNKYGRAWDVYCRRVTCRIFPFVY